MRRTETLSAPAPTLEGAGVHVAGAMRAALAIFAFSVPIDMMPLFGLSTITPICGALLAAAAAWHVLSTGRVRPMPAPLVALAAFAAWGAATTLWADDTDASLKRLFTYVQLFASTWLAWQLLRTERDLRAAMAGYLAGCTLAVAGAWQAFLSGETYFDQHAELRNPDIIEQRYTAIGFDPNDMGVTLAIGIPLAAYLLLAGTGRRRFAWGLFVPLALSGVALTGSRGAAVTAAVACGCVIVWLGRRSLVAAGVALALVVAVGAAVWQATPDTFQRVASMREQLEGGTLNHRTQIWLAGLEVLVHHPATGIGVGNFEQAVQPALGYGIVAHNVFLSVAVETGLVGALLFFGAFAWVIRDVVRGGSRGRALVIALVLVWLVGASSLSWEYRKTTWWLLAVSAAMSALRRPDGDPASA